MTEGTSAPVSSAPSTAAAGSPKKATKKTTTKSKSSAGSSHPKYSDMIKAALKALNERSGSSRAAILKYVLANYSLDPAQANQHLKLALKNGVKSKSLKQTKGNGASGSFKVNESAKPAKKKSTKTKKASGSTKSATGTKKRARSKSAGSKPAKKVATAANNNSSATATTAAAPATTGASTTTAAKPKKVRIAKSAKPKSATKSKSTKAAKPKQSKFISIDISSIEIFVFS